MDQDTLPQPSKPCHPSTGSNPDESEGDTWTSQGLKGPRAGKPPQTQVDTENRHTGPQDSHHEEAHPEWGPQGVGRHSGDSTW